MTPELPARPHGGARLHRSIHSAPRRCLRRVWLPLLLCLAGAAQLAAQPSPRPLGEAVAEHPRVRIVSVKGGLPEARGAVVVLPEGYAVGARRYPVLYLLHGLWGNHRNWLELSNLLEYTRDLPLIVVLPDGGDQWYSNSVAKPEQRFEDYIARDVIGYVDRSYRTLAFRDARYIAGLSMGGFGAYKLALKHPGLFSVVASFSGAFGLLADSSLTSLQEVFGPAGSEARQQNDVVQLLRQAQLAQPPYFYLDCGTADQLLPANRAVAAALLERGFPYEYHEVRGTHSWEYWNRRLPMVLELLRERVRALP